MINKQIVKKQIWLKMVPFVENSTNTPVTLLFLINLEYYNWSNYPVYDVMPTPGNKL